MEQTKSVFFLTLKAFDGYVRAWIAACSGREHTHAIAFKEALESTGKHRNLTLQFLLRI
jgi:hypothetical protein